MRALALALLLVPAVGLADGGYARIAGGEFRSVLDYEDNPGMQKVAAFELMRRPVTNGEFLEFVRTHKSWQRDQVPMVFAEKQHYLAHWTGPLQLGNAAGPEQPVTQVSWFAASAYCQAQDARLPTWSEWEYVAAADGTRRDARQDPVWRAQILSSETRPTNGSLVAVGQTPANVYGVQDMYGLVWEWTQDYAALLVSGDNREQSDPDRMKFCGAGALAINDRENYAVLMRVAMLSSLEAVNSTSRLGFRCARDLPARTP